MKTGVFWIAVILLLASVYASYDFTHHSKAHELRETLVNEPQAIFVLFFFKNYEGDEAKQAQVNDSRAALRQAVLGQDVYHIDVDMTDPERAEEYKEVTRLLGIPQTLIDESPVVAVAYNRAGYWIHGDSVPKETAETVQAFSRLQQQQAQKSGSTPISFGRSRHSSDGSVSVGGY